MASIGQPIIDPDPSSPGMNPGIIIALDPSIPDCGDIRWQDGRTELGMRLSDYELGFYPFPDQEVELPEVLEDQTPDEVVSTGVTDGTMPSTLSVYYFEDWTYVTSQGEFQNAAPWRYSGRVEPETVLGEYLAADEAASGEGRDWPSVYGPNTPSDWCD